MCVAHVRMSPFFNCQVACLLKAKLCAQRFPASSLCQSPPIPPRAGPAFSHVLAWTAACARLRLRTLRRPQQSRQVRQPSAAVAKKTTKAREARAVSVTREAKTIVCCVLCVVCCVKSFYKSDSTNILVRPRAQTLCSRVPPRHGRLSSACGNSGPRVLLLTAPRVLLHVSSSARGARLPPSPRSPACVLLR